MTIAADIRADARDRLREAVLDLVHDHVVVHRWAACAWARSLPAWA